MRINLEVCFSEEKNLVLLTNNFTLFLFAYEIIQEPLRAFCSKIFLLCPLYIHTSYQFSVSSANMYCKPGHIANPNLISRID